MRRKSFFSKLLAFIFFILVFSGQPLVSAENIMEITRNAGYDVLDINKPKASIIIDGTNGQILWAEEPDMVRDPASISKMMTVFLVFEAMEQGKFNLDTTITATEQDEAISQIYEISNNDIHAGVDYPVRELLPMVTVPSSNVATLMLANLVSDNDTGAFVTSMNQKAQELGMSNTFFHNCSGASAASFAGYYEPAGFDKNASNQSTARDLATMTYYLINRYPQVLEFTSKPSVTVMADTPYEETFETYNYSLPGAQYGLEGVDGLKTGSGPSSAFNYVATAKRGDTRLIEVILGVGDWSDQDGEYYRHPFGNALLEKIFNEYEYKQILAAGNHTIDGTEIHLDQDFYGVVKKSAEPTLKLENDLVQLAEPLEAAAGTMPPLAAVYQPPEQAAASDAEPSSADLSQNLLQQILNTFRNNWVSIVLVIGGILLSIISLSIPSKVQTVSPFRRARRNKTSPLKLILGILGVLSLVAGIVLFVIDRFI